MARVMKLFREELSSGGRAAFKLFAGWGLLECGGMKNDLRVDGGFALNVRCFQFQATRRSL